MRLTKKYKEDYFVNPDNKKLMEVDIENDHNSSQIIRNKLGQLEDIEDELGIDLITFLKGIDPDTCFMEITKDKKFYLCGDAYYGNYSKEELLKLIQKLLFMYWALTKEELL